MREQSFQRTAAAIFHSVGTGPSRIRSNRRARRKSLPNTRARKFFFPRTSREFPATTISTIPIANSATSASKSSDNLVLFWAKEYGDDPRPTRCRIGVSILRRPSRSANASTITTSTRSSGSTRKIVRREIQVPDLHHRRQRRHRLRRQHRQQDRRLLDSRHAHQPRPYGVVAHELGHSFQAIGRADGACIVLPAARSAK